MSDDSDDSDDFDATPSKSARKREMLGYQELAEALCRLPPVQLERIAMPDALREGLQAARKLRRAALRRQLRYLSHLIDEQTDATALRKALDGELAPGREESARLHRLERWRERMLASGDEAVEAFLAAHPAADRQHLRNLVRSAQRAVARVAAGGLDGDRGAAADAERARATRALFRYLREFEGTV